MENIKLPTIKDFRRYGKFYDLPKIDVYTDLPLLILCNIHNEYIFKPNILTDSFLEKLKLHCMVLQNIAKYEDFIEDLKTSRELQMRRLEEKLFHFYFHKLNIKEKSSK